MKNRIFIPILIVVGLISFSINSCKKDTLNTDNLYVPTSADVTTNATLQDLQNGRNLYINNCGNCHAYHSPDEFSSAQWPGILSQMIPRTGLSASDALLVSKYVTRGK